MIGLKRRQLERIDKSTLTYRAEKEELDALEQVEARWRLPNALIGASEGARNA